jgi:hypothetical protein
MAMLETVLKTAVGAAGVVLGVAGLGVLAAATVAHHRVSSVVSFVAASPWPLPILLAGLGSATAAVTAGRSLVDLHARHR